MLYPKPREGEEIPVQLIDMEKKIAAWSPEIRKTLYFEAFEQAEGLKRIREVFVLRVYNWYRDGQSIIELTNDERMQFEDIFNKFLLYRGEIRYRRKKEGRRYKNYFVLVDDSYSKKNVNEWLLAERL
ncbi:hypothetical protein [Methanohalophilus mahii]|uniref:hypothetical protein n=1 Tax=Methanohalophilus mahii TaxID=2176 RepID=UPI001FE11870|nr:hypothetical protein [Methanohalophilus mahii]